MSVGSRQASVASSWLRKRSKQQQQQQQQESGEIEVKVGKRRSMSTNGHATMKIGGQEVHAFNDGDFSRVRGLHGLEGTEFLSSISFDEMEAGGGKGGMMMAFTEDKQYIVKELNGADHGSLLRIAREYADHVLSSEGSLIARVFAHFEHAGHNYMVMNNWMPPPRIDAIDTTKLRSLNLSTNYSQYDLKGCADDKTLKKMGGKIPAVHKRIFNVPLWCGHAFWTPERTKYYEGKLHARQVRFLVSPSVHKEITSKIDRDVKFLQRWSLMDYSLVVSYHVLPRSPGSNLILDKVYRATSDHGEQPYIAHKDNQTFICYVGIIDFLQDWTTAKIIANVIKVAERNKATIPPNPYGDRFAKFVAHKFDPTCEDGDEPPVN
ncbi:hypothetical protein CTAYLR_009940 [Chrysophaeum taylorii]|uniref:PIPK domain-containing protein n=1 Tax=Chrysophaeum taylorii TaxID=2483200 RepID=A0AAD7UE24_9STRA|nr:hypothetical protein CTAYLR_009940 [Chrysophaeum taylorii]